MKIYLALFTPTPTGPCPEVNAITIAWTLIAAFSVGMQVGS